MSGPIGLARRGAVAEAPISPARDQLAAAIRDLDAVVAELAAAQEPAARLSAVIAEAAELEAERIALRRADEQRLGAWLAGGGEGPRPEPSPATLALEQRLAGLADDAAAARAALPAAEQSFQRCAERTRALQRRRDEAAYQAAFDAARGCAEGYGAALTVALEREAVLQGLRHELLVAGNRSDGEPAALAAAAKVGDLIIQTKRNAGTPLNPEVGRRLLEALRTDAGATL